MKRGLSRRQFIKLFGVLFGSAGIAMNRFFRPSWLKGAAQQGGNGQIYLPDVHGAAATTPTPTGIPTGTPTDTPTDTPTETRTPIPPPTGARVVQVHSAQATSWTGSLDYWNYVNQSVVDQMVDEGVMALTGKHTIGEAWKALLPDYQPTQKIAIKVNFNNSNSCQEAGKKIDAVAEPVNAIIRGLKLTGVPENMICIYEAKAYIPDRFASRIQYPGVNLYDQGWCSKHTEFSSSDPNALVVFHPPSGVSIAPMRLTDILIESDYLINVPIMKKHTIAGISLSFKNHFGTIQEPDRLHELIRATDGTDNSAYNPLIDIYQNPHIAQKTVFTLCDGLFGASSHYGEPVLWRTFGSKPPNSLFFATDPVALDCVLCDLLASEFTVWEHSDDYLILAEQAGLGRFERGDPWGSGYQKIDYLKLPL